MRNLYNQFVALIQELNTYVFAGIIIALLVIVLLLFVKFWKKADSEKVVFARPALLIPIVAILLVIIYLTYVRF